MRIRILSYCSKTATPSRRIANALSTICIDCRYIGARPSGIGEVSRALAELVPLAAPDLQFVLLRNPANAVPLGSAPNIREIVVGQPANSPATMWWLPRVADLGAIDLFHAPFNILPAGLAMPAVTTVHDIMWLTTPQLCRTGLRGRIDRAFYGHGIRRALRRSAHVATVSGATRDAIVARFPHLAPRVSVTLSGVATRFRPVPPEPAVLAAIGLSAGGRFVLVAGQFAPYKNHEGAVKAFAHAFARTPDIALVLVQRQGNGARRLLSLADRLGIGGRVRLTGPVAESTLLQLYSAASALLHPSFVEGFGNPVAEAMACGCPVITSNCSAMPEVAGGAARLIDPHDTAAIAQALREVVDAPQIAADMREAGLARARELSWSDFARSNVAIYRKVLGSS